MKRNRKKEHVPLARQRFPLHDLAFDCTHPALEKFSIHVTALSKEIEHFSIRFEPPISKYVASHTLISLTHLPTRACHLRLVVLPDTKNVSRLTLSDLKILAFETHAVQLEDAAVAVMWLSVINGQLKHPDQAPMYQPVIDYGWFFAKHFDKRYVGLDYFPPDPNINAAGIDPTRIPQRNPLWFKLRGEITGSAAYKLIGNFIPKLGSKEAQTFNYNKRETFSGWRLLSVTLGKLREHVQIACILAGFPTRTFFETGYHVYAKHPTWGASPDGLILDTSMSRDTVPAVTMTAYPNADPQRGVIEFKASRLDCEIKDYHMPQVVWEMLCTDTLWCDIVRYSEPPGKSPQCKTIRIFRHFETETQLIHLIENAYKVKDNPTEFLTLMWSQPYVTMREQFGRLTKFCNSDAQTVPVPTELIAEMHALCDSLSAQNISDMDIGDLPAIHPALDRIEERQSKCFALFTGKHDETSRAEFVSLATRQIDDFSELIRAMSNPPSNL